MADRSSIEPSTMGVRRRMLIHSLLVRLTIVASFQLDEAGNCGLWLQCD